MGGTGSFEGIEGTVDVVTITGSTGPIPLVESPSYDSTGLTFPVERRNYDSTGQLPRLELPITLDEFRSYDSYTNRKMIVAKMLCTITTSMKSTDFLKKGTTKGYNSIDWRVVQLHKLTYLHGAQLKNEPVQLGFVSFGKTVLKIVVKSNIPLPVAP